MNKVYRFLKFILLFGIMIRFTACGKSQTEESDTKTPDISKTPNAPTFFGDSTLTIISSNRPKGYLVKIFQNKELTLLNLSRGDSINRTIALASIPFSWEMFSIPDLTDGDKPYQTGTYIRELEIPVEKELYGDDIFFMDVNFDGEEDLLIKHGGYNRSYYACFDLINGGNNVSPGILQPMFDPPFDNIVGGAEDIYTEFDYENKKIHIYEQMGCCSHWETWCEMVRDWEWDPPKLQVVRQERVEYSVDGYEHKEIYERVDGELKKVLTKKSKIN